MAKVLMLARNYPHYHPKAGQPTYFVEKFWKCLWDLEKSNNNPLNGYFQKYDSAFPLTEDPKENIHLHLPKNHTIRAGHRFKKGDYFSPRVWGNDINPKSGRSGAYQSKQIIIAPDTLVTDVYDFEIKAAYKELPLDYDTDVIINHRFFHTDSEIMKLVSENDGLTRSELLQWFKYPKPFKGQIICWNENIKY